MSDIDPDLLKRYAEGHCSPAETALVEQWLNENDEGFNEAVFAGVNKPKLRQEIWDEVKPDLLPAKKAASFRLTQAAACMLLILIGGYWAIKWTLLQHTQPTAMQATVYKELVMATGQKARITLGDGTVVALNSESRLKYPASFTGATRTVYLSGEAHFTVAKDHAHPFIIHTAKTDVQVLGTVFNVKAYPEEGQTTLTVEEGRVQFSLSGNANRKLILTAGMQGHADISGSFTSGQVYAANYTAWKENKLVINDLSLKEITTLLRRWYAIPVEVKNKQLNRERFTGTYQQAPVDHVAYDISLALHCRFSLTDHQLTFY